MQTPANLLPRTQAAKGILRDSLARGLIIFGLALTTAWIVLLGYVLATFVALKI